MSNSNLDFDPTRVDAILLSENREGTSKGVMVNQVPAAAALLVGDFVYLDSAGKAAKSTTVANYAGRIGIVVGGKATQYRLRLLSSQVGQSAAAADGDDVLVAWGGICYGVADAAITIGAAVGVPAALSTAGRLNDASPVAGRIAGIALSSAANAGDAFLVLLALA